MKETKNKNIILIALSICLVIIMFIVYFSSSNVAKGTYGAAVNDGTGDGAIIYTITYNANGGSGAPSSQTKNYDVDLTLSSDNPTRKGYTFLGWSTSSSATSATYLAGGTYKTNASNTLYAVWKANTYTISYNANGGSGAPSSQTKTYDKKLTLSSDNPTRKGYTFLGWSTSSSATSATYLAGGIFGTNITSNTTLYAVWKKTENVGVCYLCLGESGSVDSGGYYVWSSDGSVPEGKNCHRNVNGIDNEDECKNDATPSPDFYECINPTDSGKVCVKAYDSDWASASLGEMGMSCNRVDKCSCEYTDENDCKVKNDGKTCEVSKKDGENGCYVVKTEKCYSYENKNGSGTSYQWSTTSPGTDWKLESDITEAAKCKNKEVTNKCWQCNDPDTIYYWGTSSSGGTGCSSGWRERNDKTTEKACSSGTTSGTTSCDSNSGTYNTETVCKNAYSGYTCKKNDDGCWIKGEKISGSTGGDGGSGNTGGNSNTTPSTPSSDPSSSSSSSSSSSVSSSSSSSSNATSNPQTGAISIFIIWIIALGTIVYTFYYFKQSRFE